MEKILVIEDTKAILDDMITILGFEGFDARGAENGIEGVKLAGEFLPDLIVCDILMPEMDGYGVLEALKGEPSTASIPFIFVTARAAREDLRKGMELGADDYLTKPFTTEELLSAVRTRLEKKVSETKEYTEKVERVEEKLDRATYYDLLTGLPNQIMLQKRATAVLGEIPDDAMIGVILIDLDRFRNVNEALGNDVGDSVLKTMSGRMSASADTQGAELFRLRGDHFVVLAPKLFERDDAVGVAEKMKHCIRQPVIAKGVEINITASMGISLYRRESEDIGELINMITNAEVAMRRAKERGHNNYQFYEPDMKEQALNNLALGNDLPLAIERNELRLHYQPKVDIGSNKTVGMEALVRWQHPKLGVVQPGSFIPLAEETGFVIPLGEWVLNAACKQNKSWLTAGIGPRTVAVNISAQHLVRPDMVKTVAGALKKSGLEPRYLEIEITESAIMKDPDAAVEVFGKLKDLGVSIAIDDFGTGYSSLAYLKRFPIDSLKIDRSFIRDVTTNEKDAAIVVAVIAMAHGLGIKAIAEGIETREQLDFLRANRCDQMQGYLFSRPLPDKEFTDLLREDRSLPSG
ncbi:MAG: EAL domain-containing protein [Thermodesulfobacteriota bacterium]